MRPASGAETTPRAETAISEVWISDRRVGVIRHVGAGALYGIADSEHPGDAHLDALRPVNVTQMAPGGGQLPNGTTVPTGDALVVAPIAARHGASVTIRLPDTYPDFPYRWQGWDDWEARVSEVARAVRASGAPNIYAYELWNEPNWTWPPEAGDFGEAWRRTASIVRRIDPSARVLGPSIDRWDAEWMRRFLLAAESGGSRPDVVSWHELDPADTDVERHVAEYRALEVSLGMPRLPISINEYGPHRDMAVPGELVGWLARLERADVDTANLAFWHHPGRFSDLVTSANEPTGAWWIFRWYAEMAGRRLETTGSGTPSVLASVGDAGLTALVGGGSGDLRIVIDDALVPSSADDSHRVIVEESRWTGTDGASPTVITLISAPVRVGDGPVALVLPALDPLSGYRIRIVPQARSGGGAAEWRSFDDLAVEGARVRDERAITGIAVELSAGQRLTLASGADRSLSEASIRYRHGGPHPASLRFLVDGVDAATLSLPSGEGMSTVAIPPADWVAINRLEEFTILTEDDVVLDSLRVTPYRRRYEAERAAIVRGSIQNVDMSLNAFRSNRFSGDGFANWLNELDSSVTFSVYAPVAGSYRLTIGYALGAGPAQHQLRIDDLPVAVIDYPPTQGDELVGIVNTEVTLAAGSHRIALAKADLPGAPALDFLEITGLRREAPAS
jgi:hypothetical protein